MNLSIERKILIAFAVALGFMIVIGLVSYQNTVRFAENSQQVERTHEVLERLKDVSSAIKDAETGQRGYILTGRNSYLAPYEEATQFLDQNLLDLRALVSNNSTQLDRLDILTSLVAQRIDIMKETITLRETEGFESALQLILTDKGKQTMDSIRGVIGEIENAERKLLAQRREEEQASARETVLALLLGGVLALLAIASALFVIHRDIVRSEQLRRELEMAKEAAEGATEAKSQFLAHMSHEVRTPMNGIIGITNLLLESKLTREQRESLEMVKSSADALMRVINDILDFSKIEAGKMQLENVEFSLRQCIEDSIQTFAIPAEEKGIELLFQINTNVPDRVIGDPGRLRQTIINLVGNAVKFTAAGEVSVMVEKELETKDSLSIHCTVTDTGRGIPPEQTAKIFEAFVQGDPSLTRTVGGTGLGLSISSQLVAMMGGRIWLESEVGKGTKLHFIVRLGLLQVVSPAMHSTLKGKTVLVVDDNLTNRTSIHRTLSDWGMKVQVAESGEVALKHIEQAVADGGPFDVIVLDRNMPVMNGFETAAVIRQDPRNSQSAIVMLLSASRPEDVNRCHLMGITAYLLKPIKQSSLLDALLNVFAPAGEAEKHHAVESRERQEEPRLRGLHILVAEDNPINQRVAVGILTKRGHRVTIASDGNEAVRLFTRERFDLVLMDVQMPELDGVQAASAIREWEKKTGGSVPIVAVTADALKGDKERYLAAGMNDYVSKPFEPKVLLSVVEGLVPPETVRSLNGPKGGTKLLDERKALSLVDGQTDLLAHLVMSFLKKSSTIMSDIKESIESQDAQKLEKSAHYLRGSAGYFVQKEVLEPARQIEAKGAARQLDGAFELYAELERMVNQLRQELEEYSKKFQQSSST